MTRRTRSRRAVAVLALALVGVLAACTPAQYQAWWTSLGNPPLKEPELSQRAALATAYWNEVARQNRFTWSVQRIDAALAARMTPTTWRPGCPVPLSSLRYVRVSHMGFDGKEHLGEMVLHADAANYAVLAFKLLWNESFPIQQMRLVDDFGGGDDASMAANNTSGFNCRKVAGTSTWSQHAYGRAIDLNPVQNPYVSGSLVEPAAGRSYLDRSKVRPGMLVGGTSAVHAFARVGWGWGGSWSGAKDYQHVSANGR